MPTWIRCIVPLLAALMLVYCSYVMFHVVGYRLLYAHLLKPAAYVLWVVLAVVLPSIFLYWGVILLRGAGTIPDLLVFPAEVTNKSSLTPPAFLCDALGFPFYCSQCQRLKPERAFHLSFDDRCVPRYDHYCLWLGAVVGLDSLVPFVKFVEFVAVFSVLNICYVGTTIKHAIHNSAMLLHLIAVLILMVMSAVLSFGLFLTTSTQIFNGRTTLDAIAVKQAAAQKRWEKRTHKNKWYITMLFPAPKRFETGTRYVNVQNGSSRAVVSYDLAQDPYSFGIRQNIIDAFYYGNRVPPEHLQLSVWPAILLALVPYIDLCALRLKWSDCSYEAFSDGFGPDFLDFVGLQLSKGAYLIPGYIPTTSPLPNETEHDSEPHPEPEPIK